MGAIRQLQTMDDDELYVYAKELRAPIELVRKTKHLGRLPVVNFAAGNLSQLSRSRPLVWIRPIDVWLAIQSNIGTSSLCL